MELGIHAKYVYRRDLPVYAGDLGAGLKTKSVRGESASGLTPNQTRLWNPKELVNRANESAVHCLLCPGFARAELCRRFSYSGGCMSSCNIDRREGTGMLCKLDDPLEVGGHFGHRTLRCQVVGPSVKTTAMVSAA